MSHTPHTDLTPAELRLAALAAVLYDNLDAEYAADAHALADLDPTVRGMRTRVEDGHVVLSWVGRDLARVPHSWIVEGRA
jgi:hypothetical protein